MEGYAKFAAMMGQHPEMAVFRTFRALNMKNLLYLQAELVELERDLEVIAELDEASGIPQKAEYARSWVALNRSEAEGDGYQLRKVLTIREKLKQYNDVLVQQAQMFALEQPNSWDLKFLREWLGGWNMSGNFLTGLEQLIWDEKNEADLVSLRKPQPEKDVFSAWFTGTFLDYFHRCLGQYIKKPIPIDVESGIRNYDNSTLLALADVVCTVCACLIPISSIVVLYLVKNVLTRLGLVAGFTALFSFTLAIVTKARRIEVFAATAAFASVQVVFIGTTNN
ncbi:hypothetical protein MMC16_003731 [Acarospora aff. strigata]|nr:hypothetical protein [Acarospora aff. strigata]